MHDRAHSGEREPGPDVDEQLLADADVDHPVGVAPLGLAEVLPADLGVHQRHGEVLVEQGGRRAREGLPGVTHFASTSATTTEGRPGTGRFSASSSCA